MNLCDIKSQPLPDDYIIKKNESYVISIEELTFKNMEFSGNLFSSAGNISINEIPIENYEHCNDTHKEEGIYESFRVKISDMKEINETEIQNTQINENDSTIQNENQSAYESISPYDQLHTNNKQVTILYGLIITLIIIIIILIAKLKKIDK